MRMESEMKVIGSEKRMCSCCMKEHDVKKISVEEHTIFKNTPVDYDAEYYYCDNADELYADEEMTSDNDIRMKDSYRKVMGLLTSEEICGIREKYEISQTDLCALLGWGGKTITRYESHQVQDRAHDAILKKLDQDPEWFLYLLKETEKTLAQERYRKYLEKGRILYEKHQDAYLRKAIEAKYARVCADNGESGEIQPPLEKVFEDMRRLLDAVDGN